MFLTTPIRRVLDISHHNDVTSWPQMIDAGIWGIIHKATEGGDYVDDRYDNVKRKFDRIGIELERIIRNRIGSVAQAKHFLRVTGIHDDLLIASTGKTTAPIQCPSAGSDLPRVHGFADRSKQMCVYAGTQRKRPLATARIPSSAPIGWAGTVWIESVVQPSWDTYWLWQYSDGQNGPSPHGCPGVNGDVDTNSGWD